MDYNRLRWASRRGMLELDLILAPFIESHYPMLDEKDQLKFQALVQCEDQDLFNWFLQKVEPEDTDIKHIVNIIRESSLKAS